MMSYLHGGYECLICGKKTFHFPICKKCRNDYFSVEKSLKKERCSICGKELISIKNKCMECRESQTLFHLDKMVPLFSYRLWNKNLLFLWKIEGMRIFSKFFCDLVYQALILERIDYVVPIPPRPGKIRENGWDQIDELCSFLQAFYKVKIIRLLERKSKIQQKKLDRNERLSSIESSYYLVSQKKIKKIMKKEAALKEKRICLVDDVCTTGATLESCSKILKDFGLTYVSAITLFNVD